MYSFWISCIREYVIYCTRFCVKSYQTRTTFNAENVTWKGRRAEFSRFSFSISRVFSSISRYVYELSPQSCREMDLDELKRFPFLVRGTQGIDRSPNSKRKVIFVEKTFLSSDIKNSSDNGTHGRVSFIVAHVQLLTRDRWCCEHFIPSCISSVLSPPFSSFLSKYIPLANLMRNSTSVIVQL